MAPGIPTLAVGGEGGRGIPILGSKVWSMGPGITNLVRNGEGGRGPWNVYLGSDVVSARAPESLYVTAWKGTVEPEVPILAL
jgi:hypothetical protein